MNRQDAANRNRELMPNVAALVDEWREHFPNLKVIYAKDLETGHEVGKQSEPIRFWTIPDDFKPHKPVQQDARKRK